MTYKEKTYTMLPLFWKTEVENNLPVKCRCICTRKICPDWVFNFIFHSNEVNFPFIFWREHVWIVFLTYCQISVHFWNSKVAVIGTTFYNKSLKKDSSTLTCEIINISATNNSGIESFWNCGLKFLIAFDIWWVKVKVSRFIHLFRTHIMRHKLQIDFGIAHKD